MEEHVGQIWDRFITRAADTRHPEAGVSLQEVNRTVGILFRALGGDGGLQVEAANATDHHARRSWLQRIADSNRQVELAWRDELSLRLPATIDCFPTRSLNRDLYLWLAAMAVGDRGDEEAWFAKNQRLTLETLKNYPGIKPRYERLVTAHLKQRIDPAKLPKAEALQAQAICAALHQPGTYGLLPSANKAPQPVPLWLHPSPPTATPYTGLSDEKSDSTGNGPTQELEDQRRRKAEQTEKAAEDRGLITLRMETIFTWADFIKLDRGTEEDEDLESAANAADDMETMSITRDGASSASQLRFDLDLPSEANDDRILGEGIFLPEWDYKKQSLQPDHCRLFPMIAANAVPCALPKHLNHTARKLKAQFQQLAPARIWYRGQQDGCEIDLDAYLRFTSDRASGYQAVADNLYRDLRVGARDLACLLLADLSLSTDSWINNQRRVIDVVQDSLFLFAESLDATSDPFAIYGFSSRKRDPIRFHQIKTFQERYSADIRGRINAIKPGYYTRMGAAIRHGANLLTEQPASRRLLLILTDGKPNDLDQYEGRYGIEDTRQAVNAARQLGLQPFCVTIDRRGNDYLPYLFGSGNYVLIHKPSQLPRELPLLYAKLTA